MTFWFKKVKLFCSLTTKLLIEQKSSLLQRLTYSSQWLWRACIKMHIKSLKRPHIEWKNLIHAVNFELQWFFLFLDRGITRCSQKLTFLLLYLHCEAQNTWWNSATLEYWGCSLFFYHVGIFASKFLNFVGIATAINNFTH